MLRRLRRLPLSLGVVVVLTMGAGGVAAAQGTARPKLASSPTLPALNVAEHDAVDLGLLPARSPVSFTLTLRERDTSALHTLLNAGGTTTDAQWVSTYGPEPSLVARLRRVLTRAGLSSSWAPGDTVLAVTGPAKSVDHFLRLSIHRFVFNKTTRFYAALSQPVPPKSIAREVLSVSGTNDYPAQVTAAIPTGDGVTPGQMSSFYDLTPLRKAGLDGSGMTVIFPEWAVPDSSTLNAYANKFHLPAFNVEVKTNSAWGQGDTSTSDSAGEAALDLEIVHGLAPGAREIVYEIGNPSQLPLVLQTMTKDNPGAILSSSISNGACEDQQGGRATTIATNAAFEHAAANGSSMFWATGDRGAFSCLPNGDPSTEEADSISINAGSPYVTAVGGTTAFLASNGSYYKEAAWGEPLETWGSGGGISAVFAQPSYQVAPGLGAKTLGGRGVPDVSANADIASGWDTFDPTSKGPQEGAVGGTSAATPFWAATTALIDEDLTHQGLPEVGFINPALYFFAGDPAGLPATPFHQVTEGSNFHFVATAGWNAATGLGTPDAGHLADDFEWYEKSHLNAG
jgi:subtilase family serine protease